MNLNEYQAWTGATCAKLESKKLDNLHMLLGMTTEVGELSDVFKKEMAYNVPVDWVNVGEELGDILFYLASFARINDINLEEVLDKNMKKLSARYPEKFSEYYAKNRDLIRERLILEE